MRVTLIFIISLLASFQASAYSRLQGNCEQGNKTITVSGWTSSTNTPVMRSYPRCTVNVYLAGTTTPAALFSTATGTSLSNPITADSTGHWMFFIADGNYDLAFSNGGIPVPFTYGSNPSTDPYFESTLPGYVNRTKNSKLADVVSVKDFGCVGDGTTDDTACLQAALSYSDLTHCVFFPNGTYTTTQSLVKTSHGAGNQQPVCWTGNASGTVIKATATMTWIMALIGDPNNNHSQNLQNSVLSNFIFDGGAINDHASNATGGVLFQGVISAQFDFNRVRNVTGACLSLTWAQQTNAFQFQCSQNTEGTAWVTRPTIGLTIGNNSSANTFWNINIDHIKGNGIEAVYSLNAFFAGGTSEGNDGWGVICTSSGTAPIGSPNQCFNNTWVQFDAEANGLATNNNTVGDFYFGGGTFRNSVIQANSFSHPGVLFDGSAHNNNIIGGTIGGHSSAGANTFGNRLIGVAAVEVGDDIIWTDNGNNCTDRIYNEFTAHFIEGACYYQNTQTWGNYPSGTQKIVMNTSLLPQATMYVGDLTTPKANWVGNDCQDGFFSCWIIFPTNNKPDGHPPNEDYGGIQFVGETTPNTQAVTEYTIRSHKHGWGRFNVNPQFTFDMSDAVASTLAVRAGSGQGGADLIGFYAYGGDVDTVGTKLGAVDHLGQWNGPIAGGTTGAALCKKSDKTIGSCTSAVDSSGNCTCN